MKVLHTIALSLGLFSVATAGQVNVEAQKGQAAMPQVENAKQEKVTLIVSGMTWGAGCAAKVQVALKKIDGVISAKADHKKGQAVVKVDRDKVTNEQLTAGLKKNSNGKYTATVK